jgi:hypothetical protein
VSVFQIAPDRITHRRRSAARPRLLFDDRAARTTGSAAEITSTAAERVAPRSVIDKPLHLVRDWYPDNAISDHDFGKQILRGALTLGAPSRATSARLRTTHRPRAGSKR